MYVEIPMDRLRAWKQQAEEKLAANKHDLDANRDLILIENEIARKDTQYPNFVKLFSS